MGSLFVEARAAEGDFHGIYGGLRFYFGNHQFTLGGSTGQQSVPQQPQQQSPAQAVPSG